MSKPCEICPFTKSPAAIGYFGEAECNQIDECAEILLGQGQMYPHVCFKYDCDVQRRVDPSKNELPCRGHEQWLAEHPLEIPS